MESIVKMSEGYELVPSKSGIQAMVQDMMLKIDIVLGNVDSEDNPKAENVVLPEGFSVNSVLNLAAQSKMMEEFSTAFKKEIAKRLPKVLEMFEGDPAMNKAGTTLTYGGVTITKKAGAKKYDFSSSKAWKEADMKVAKYELKLQAAKTDREAIEKKMKATGEGYVTDQAPATASMSLGR